MEQDNMKIASILDALEKYANDRGLMLWFHVNHEENKCAFMCKEPGHFPLEVSARTVLVKINEIDSLEEGIAACIDEWDRYFWR